MFLTVLVQYLRVPQFSHLWRCSESRGYSDGHILREAWLGAIPARPPKPAAIDRRISHKPQATRRFSRNMYKLTAVLKLKHVFSTNLGLLLCKSKDLPPPPLFLRHTKDGCGRPPKKPAPLSLPPPQSSRFRVFLSTDTAPESHRCPGGPQVPAAREVGLLHLCEFIEETEGRSEPQTERTQRRGPSGWRRAGSEQRLARMAEEGRAGWKESS